MGAVQVRSILPSGGGNSSPLRCDLHHTALRNHDVAQSEYPLRGPDSHAEPLNIARILSHEAEKPVKFFKKLFERSQLAVKRAAKDRQHARCALSRKTAALNVNTSAVATRGQARRIVLRRQNFFPSGINYRDKRLLYWSSRFFGRERSYRIAKFDSAAAHIISLIIECGKHFAASNAIATAASCDKIRFALVAVIRPWFYMIYGISTAAAVDADTAERNFCLKVIALRSFRVAHARRTLRVADLFPNGV